MSPAELLEAAPWLDELMSVLRARFGIVTPDNRIKALHKATLEAAAELDLNQPHGLLPTLRTGAFDDPDVQRLLGRITINESYFFRDPRLMGALRSRILPRLVEQRASEGVLRIWSAGCSYGEEAYTLAILAREAAPTPRFRVEVLGTDLDADAVAAAREATYRDGSLRACSEEQRRRYFVRSGPNRHRLRDELRDGVEFRIDNLMDPILAHTRHSFDLIVCRNVTIYFDDAGIELAHTKVARYLAPDGIAALGVLEQRTLPGLRALDGYPPGVPVYGRRAEGGAEAAASDPSLEGVTPAPRSAPRPAADTVRPRAKGLGLPGAAGRVTVAASPRRPLPEALPIEPTLNLARARADRGELQGALELLSRLIETHPLDHRAYELAAIVQQELGRLREAELFLRQALYLAPLHAQMHGRHAMVLVALGEERRAAKAWARSRLLADSPDPRLGAGSTPENGDG